MGSMPQFDPYGQYFARRQLVNDWTYRSTCNSKIRRAKNTFKPNVIKLLRQKMYIFVGSKIYLILTYNINWDSRFDRVHRVSLGTHYILSFIFLHIPPIIICHHDVNVLEGRTQLCPHSLATSWNKFN